MNFAVSERLENLPRYLFAELRSRMAEARAKGVDVIRVDIGDPDLPTPEPVVQEVCRAVMDTADVDRHRYGCDRPVLDLKETVRAYYLRRFGVALSENQIVMTSGTKDAIVQFCMGLLNPGDLGIAPVPGYPTYNIGHVFCSASTHYVPLRAQNNYLLDFDEIPQEVCRQAKLLWINYPNNPTTSTADFDYFERAVAFGRKHNLLVCHDAAYIENCYDGYRAPSILQVRDASDVAVEFYSLSKGFNMTGWRVGFVAGNSTAVAALNAVKENVDNGTFRPIQWAAKTALDNSETLTDRINSVYQRRRDMVIDMLLSAGWGVHKPRGTIYLWLPVPPAYEGDSGTFCADLLQKNGVMVTPGRGYGPSGEGYFRMSLSYSEGVLKEATRRILELRR